MIVSFIVAFYLEMIHESMGFVPLASHVKLILGVTITTVSWLLVTYLTPPESKEVLVSFYKKVIPPGPGWKRINEKVGRDEKSRPSPAGSLSVQLLAALFGTLSIFSFLFFVGSLIYQDYFSGILYFILFLAGAFWIFKKRHGLGLNR
jgi:hypothetical protein